MKKFQSLASFDLKMLIAAPLDRTKPLNEGGVIAFGLADYTPDEWERLLNSGPSEY